MMKRSTKWWLGIWAVFGAVNVAGAVWAAALTEGIHAASHVVLAALSVYVVWRLARPSGEPQAVVAPLMDRRLDELQQSVDAVALEVERIGEAQRYHAKVAAERAEPKR